jgi:uncharacterized SAM-binding protein YcdF (DUF218 family)
MPVLAVQAKPCAAKSDLSLSAERPSVSRAGDSPAAAMRRFLRATLVAVLILAAGVYLARASILEKAGVFLIADDAPQTSDAIVVLSGSFPDRILEAVALYRDGYAKQILLCRDPENYALNLLKERGVKMDPGFERNRYVAESLGVQPQAISVIGESAASTFGEARQVLHDVRQRGFHSILLVTSKIHTRRAGVIYRYLAGDGVRILTRPARDDSFRPDTWWHNRAQVRRVVIEYQKLLVFFLLDRWRTSPLDEESAT